MKAMILAAGFGTRLKPVTDDIPKALVPFRKGTLLSYQIDKLKKAGIEELIINTHHLSEKIYDYIFNNEFDIRIHLTYEKEILGTGSGIINAKDFFAGEKNFLVCNVDVFTDYDIKKFLYSHNTSLLAGLLVQKRPTTRYLRFDKDMNLISRIKTNQPGIYDYAYNGMMILSTDFFNKGFTKTYSDIISLLMQIKDKECVKGIDAGDAVFADLGKIDNLNKFNN